MAAKYTPWFPSSVKPVHVGVYQRLYNQPPEPFYCHWDGKKWGFAEDRAKDARPDLWHVSPFQEKPWRGLAEQPK